MAEFKVRPDEAIIVHSAPLATTVTQLLQQTDMPPEDAALAADVLVRADLRGVDTHGVSNMLRVYIERLKTGMYNPRPTVRTIRESPATATLDSDWGLGVVTAPRAMAIAIQKAKTVGVGMVTVGNGRHLGMSAYHAMLALPHDMIGICTTAVGPSMVPTWGREPRMGTNPIAVAVPCGEEPAFVYDGATTAVAGNKIGSARRVGGILPPGLIADSDGVPIMDAVLPPQDDVRLLPLGSTYEAGSHKGYGLACVVEVLGSVLSGSQVGFIAGPGAANHFVAALDVAAFADLATFKSDMDGFVRGLKITPPAAGRERVVVAGQLEWETERHRTVHGIPLHPEVIDWFDKACDNAGVARLERASQPGLQAEAQRT
ncbi:MAG TPA: Ldh family oxidoreductase [Chloroflexota bacterium]|nr:Ldh family oxidoreductase [Chloroflexota bacterium]